MPAANLAAMSIVNSNPGMVSINEGSKLPDILKKIADQYTEFNKISTSKKLIPAEYEIKLIDESQLTSPTPDQLTGLKQALKEMQNTIFRNRPFPEDIGRMYGISPSNVTEQQTGQVQNTGRPTSSGQEFKFAKGTFSDNIINEIMIRTDWFIDQAERYKNNQLGNKAFYGWKIDKKEIIKTQSNQNNKLESGQKIIITISPEEKKAINFLGATADASVSGTQTFRNYEYMFTGKNEDIIRWDIAYDGLYYSELFAGDVPEQLSGLTSQNGYSNPNTSFPILERNNNVNSWKSRQPIKATHSSVGPTAGQAGRVVNNAEQNSTWFFENLLRLSGSQGYLQLEIDIVGDPEWLGAFHQGEMNAAMNYNASPQIGIRFLTPSDVSMGKNGYTYGEFKRADFSGVYSP